MPHTRFLLAGVAICFAADLAAAVDAPRLRQLIRGAQLVGVAHVSSVEDLDYGKIRVHEVRIEKELKPGNEKEPRTIRVVSMPQQPGGVSAETGTVGVVFARRLRRNSYFDLHVPNSHDAYELVGKRDGWLAAVEERELPSIVAPVETVINQSRKPASATKARGADRRSLTFALLSAAHPLLVDDGIASLATIQGLAGNLSDTEIGIITSAIHKTSLPMSARKKLINKIAELDLRQLAGSLRELREPQLRETAWAALRRMGEPVSEEALREILADDEPGARLAAARELLARDPESSIPLVSRTALQDRDKDVRLGVIEALGDTKSKSAVPPLEKVFAGNDDAERQASARALLKIGGDPAADALHRLAFTGPVESQRYAVVALMSLQVGRDDRRIQDIAARHKDAKVQAILDEHGFHPGHKH